MGISSGRGVEESRRRGGDGDEEATGNKHCRSLSCFAYVESSVGVSNLTNPSAFF